MNLSQLKFNSSSHIQLLFFPLALFALFISFRTRRSMYSPVGLIAVLSLLVAALDLVPGIATAQRVVHTLLSATAGASLLHLLYLARPPHPRFDLLLAPPFAILCAATLTALLPSILLPVVLPPALVIAYTLSTVPLTILLLRTRPPDAPASVPLSLSLSFTLPPSPASSAASFPSTDEKPTLSHPPSSWFPEPEAQTVAPPQPHFIPLHVLGAQFASVLGSIFALMTILFHSTIAFPILSTAFTALSLLAILSAYHRLMCLPSSTPVTTTYDPYTSPVTTPPRPLLPSPLRSPIRTKSKLHRTLTSLSPKSPTALNTHTRSPPSASSSFFSPWPRPPPTSSSDTTDPHSQGDAGNLTPPRPAYTNAYDIEDAFNDVRDVRTCSYGYSASVHQSTSTQSMPRESTHSASGSTTTSVYMQLPLRHPTYPIYPTYTPRHTLPAYGRAWVCPPDGDGIGTFTRTAWGRRRGRVEERESEPGYEGEGDEADFTDLRDPFASAALPAGAHVRIVSGLGTGGYRMIGRTQEYVDGKGKMKVKAKSVDGHVFGDVNGDVYHATGERSVGRCASVCSATAGSGSISTLSLEGSSSKIQPNSSPTPTDSTRIHAAPAPRTRMSAWGRLPIPLRSTGTGTAVACATSGGTGTLLLPLAGGRARRRGKGRGKGKSERIENGKENPIGKQRSGNVMGEKEEVEERLEESAALAQRLLKNLNGV